MSVRLATVVTTLLACPIWLVSPAIAEGSPPDDPCKKDFTSPACVAGSGAEFTAGGIHRAEGGATSVAHRPGKQTSSYVVFRYAPACTGNTREDVDLVCTSALTACLPADRGLIAYWRWEAAVSRATGEVIEPPGWTLSPETYCLGPTAEGLPPTAVVAGMLADQFERLLVDKGTVHVEPDGTTLVNYETGFFTDAKRYQLAPVTILGHRVLVTAIPQSYDWYFGDGTQTLDGGPGAQGTLQVSHTYSRTGAVAPYVVITWRGTFTVDGGPPQAVFGTAQTTSPGTPLRVKQARAELVAR